MLGKNNNKERIRKMEMQAKQDHFSIRKLTIGAASVLLGFTFFGLNSHTAKADTIDPAKEEISSETNKSQTESDQTADKADSASTNKQTSSKKQNTDLTTFSGLSSFLKDSEKANPTSSAKDSTAKTNDSKAEDQKDKENTADNSAKTPAPDQDQSATKDPSKTDGAVDQDNSKTNSAEKTDSQTPALVNKDPKRDATTDTVAKVTNWTQLKNAYSDAKVSEIDIMNNIAADSDGLHTVLATVPGRKLLIKSAGTEKYKIDFKQNHPDCDKRNSTDITYENLELWSADYWGVFSTYGLSGTGGSKDVNVNIRFKNVDYYGSQLIYAQANTHIYFYGANNINTIKTPYNGGPTELNDQQLFEFNGKNCSVEFVDGEFTGTTYGGSMIEMTGDNVSVKVDQNTAVNLTPLVNYDASRTYGEHW